MADVEQAGTAIREDLLAAGDVVELVGDRVLLLKVVIRPVQASSDTDGRGEELIPLIKLLSRLLTVVENVVGHSDTQGCRSSGKPRLLKRETVALVSPTGHLYTQ